MTDGMKAGIEIIRHVYGTTYIIRSFVHGQLCTGSGNSESEAIMNHERAVINAHIVYG